MESRVLGPCLLVPSSSLSLFVLAACLFFGFVFPLASRLLASAGVCFCPPLFGPLASSLLVLRLCEATPPPPLRRPSGLASGSLGLLCCSRHHCGGPPALVVIKMAWYTVGYLVQVRLHIPLKKPHTHFTMLVLPGVLFKVRVTVAG